MNRFICALIFCCSLLLLLGFILFPRVEAKVDPVRILLDQPAPPPPNPLVKVLGRTDEKFYDKSKPPADNASIEDLLDYWAYQNTRYGALSYSPEMTETVAERIFAEISRDPEKLPNLLNSLPDGKRSAEFVKDLYDREGKDGVYSIADRTAIKQWLTYNSPYFSSDLTRAAEQVREENEYVSNHEDLLALTSVDYDRAKPIIDRLYSNSSQKVPQVLAKWARYRNALLTNSTSDIETYRNELKAVVEDKTATAGMRDLALDALSREKDWPERDEWYFSLLGDETLADLRVNGQTFTGLTTMLMVTPEDKYIAKMLELVKSDNLTIRSAAVRNLTMRLNADNPEILRALVPWLSDPKWVTDYSGARASYISSLSEHDVPESVPGLIKVLDEKDAVPIRYATNSNRVANYPSVIDNPRVAANSPVNSMANAANAAANAMSRAADAMAAADRTPYRMAAVGALTRQKDQQAAPALRRVLTEVDVYERGVVVRTLLACNGFTIPELLDGLETKAKGVRTEIELGEQWAMNSNSTAAYPNVSGASVPIANSPAVNGTWAEAQAAMRKPMTPLDLRILIGEQLAQSPDISDELATAVVDRIESIETKDPKLANAYRRIILGWKNSAVNILFLRDLKRGTADVDMMVQLISRRDVLRTKHSADLADLRSGKGFPTGFASCLFEEPRDSETLIETGDADAKVGLYACSRLIRLQLPVAKIGPDLKSPNQLLKLAAERYLESEDSPEARSLVLSVYPNEIKILGARGSFSVDGKIDNASEFLYALFQSVSNNSLYNGWFESRNDSDLIKTEKSLVDEMKKDGDLANLYSYDGNYIRIYKDRAIFSWDEDESRYRERPLTKGEFDGFTEFLRSQNADSLPPFVTCGGGYCSSKEFLMIRRSGGRRIYFSGSDEETKRSGPAFPAGLNDLFAQLKKQPATLKYTLSKEIRGLEIVFASDDLHAETVWKGDGDDLRIVGSITDVRKKVDEEIENLDTEAAVITATEAFEANQRKRSEILENRRYDGFAWYRIANGGLQPGAVQPLEVEFLPVRDGFAVQPSTEQWKARTADVEIRASETGLHKLIRGKLMRLKTGNYSYPVISADGRWVVARKTDDQGGNTIVRVDLLTGREFPIAAEQYRYYVPSALVRSLNRILITSEINEYSEYREPNDDNVADDPDPQMMLLVDAVGGSIHQLPGNLGPLNQQTFRPLQQSLKPNELWAAIPDTEKNETLVGTFNWKTFAFTQVLRIPKIRFNSMSMWVDEPANKVYFVYRGHLLAMPLGK